MGSNKVNSQLGNAQIADQLEFELDTVLNAVEISCALPSAPCGLFFGRDLTSFDSIRLFSTDGAKVYLGLDPDAPDPEQCFRVSDVDNVTMRFQNGKLTIDANETASALLSIFAFDVAGGLVLQTTIETLGVNQLITSGAGDCGFDAPGSGGAIWWNTASNAFRLNDGYGAQILSNQQPTVAAADGTLAGVTARFNELRAALRIHGLIA